MHCCKHFPLFTQIPVYATSPVIAFGRTLLQDLYSSNPLAATFISPSGAQPEAEAVSANDVSKTSILAQAPTSEEIAKYFSLITPLKYSQPYPPTAASFAPSLEGLTLTAFNSGHTVGGTIWHIQHGMESIVYAIDWNQARENVIGGAAWFGGIGASEVIEQLRRPTALVCSSKGGNKVALSGGRKKRDELLLDNIKSSLIKDGTVLIPTDSSARVLELAWILEKAWQEGQNDPALKGAKVFLASKSGLATVRHARSLLEWMDDSIVREFEGDEEAVTKNHRRTGSKQTNGQPEMSRPFEFKQVKMIERQAQLEKALSAKGPKVILASDLSLDWGYSKQVFQHICPNPENLVLLTEKTTGELGSEIWKWFNDRQDGVALEKTSDGDQLEQVHTGGRTLSLHQITKGPLDEQELHVYQQYMATQNELQASFVPGQEPGTGGVDDAAEDSDSSSDEDEDEEHQGRVLNVSAAIGNAGRRKAAISDEDMGVGILLRKKGVYDFDVRNKKGRNTVFPYVHSRKRADEFGEYIRPEDYLRAEEKEEEPSQMPGSRFGAGWKRKFDNDKGAQQDSPSKRRQTGKGERSSDPTQDAIDAIVNGGIADDSDESEEKEEAEPEKDDVGGPSKVIYSSATVTVNARLAYVDFAGVHDQRSLQMLIPLIGPRKLVLTAGAMEETEALAADCKSLLAMDEGESEASKAAEIFAPAVGDTVDASVDTNAWIVKLSRNLVRRLQWQAVRTMNVVTLTGQLKAEQLVHEEDAAVVSNKKQKLLKEDDKSQVDHPMAEQVEKEVDPLLDIVPSNMATASRSGAQPLHVGDIRLADLRRLMTGAGYLAEFRGAGTLVINGNIAVRKLATGKIVVEGMPTNAAMTPSQGRSNYHEVKRQIYSTLASVGAG